MHDSNLISFVRHGDLFVYCKENNIFDSIIGAFPPELATQNMTTYSSLKRDFSAAGPLAKLLREDKQRILLICDEFSISEFHEILPLIAKRSARTVIINLGCGTSGLFTKGKAEIDDIDMVLEHGIACCEPADVESFLRMLESSTPTYIRTADKDLPQKLFEDKPTPELFSGTLELLAAPSFTLICGGYLFQEALAFAQRAEQLGQQPAVFCFQNYSTALSPECIQALERSDRCVILLDQAETNGYGEYLASKLPPAITEQLSFHFITPDTTHITTPYAELAYEQAGMSI